jgi:hypothetical protein
MAQTFTALHTGTLVRAQVAEIEKVEFGGDFQAQILPVDASGTPVNGPLATTRIPDASVPVGISTLSVTFGSPANVTAGQQYALVVSRLSAASGVGFGYRDRNDNPCAGQEFFSDTQVGGWSAGGPQYDLIFSTFVNPTNQFTVGKLKRRTLTVTVPGPGELSVARPSPSPGGAVPAARKAVRKLVRRSTAAATAAGRVTVPLRLTKLGKSLLRERGRLKVPAAITYTPTGGEPSTLTRKLKLKVGGGRR